MILNHMLCTGGNTKNHNIEMFFLCQNNGFEVSQFLQKYSLISRLHNTVMTLLRLYTENENLMELNPNGFQS